MKTRLVEITDVNAKTEELAEAASIIQNGGLVAFPTETVYGLGGNGLDEDAAAKIYAAKGRPSDNPLILHIAETKELYKIAENVPEIALRLSEAFWPGPLTMILPKAKEVPYGTTGGLDTVAIRMPDHPVALELIRRSGCPIAAPSANTSGRPSPTLATHVYEDLQGKIPMILDGGQVGIGIESTIIDLTEEVPMVLRPGYINRSMLEEVIGEVRMDPALMEVKGDAKPKAPGMKYRHYAPKADLIVISGEDEKVLAKMQELLAQGEAEGKKVGIICTTEHVSAFTGKKVLCVGSKTHEEEIAQNLFRVLRECDSLELDLIYAEDLDTPMLGMAVMNRLNKAAAHQIIRV